MSYLSANAATKVENIKQVCKMLIFCVSVNFPTFMLGDFNLPHIDWGIPVSHSGPNTKLVSNFGYAIF